MHMKTVVTISCISLLAVGTAFSPRAEAQASACGEERDVKQGLLDEATWKRMNRAYEMVGEEKYDAAMDDLIYLRNRAKDDYLKAVVAQGTAQVHWAQGNFDAALADFETAVELDALPDRTHYSLMYQIAQLYYSKERFDEALDRLELWFCKVPEEDHKATAYVLQGSINAQKEDWPAVVKSIDKAISMEESPKENWYALKLAAHFQQNQFSEAADTLEILISKWPNKKTYWTQLSNTYYRIKEDDKALSVIALAYRKGLLDQQQDLLYLSNLYSFKDVPFKAASVMQKGLQDGIIANEEKYWTQVGDTWYAAEEYEEALAAFEKAGELADIGKIDLRRAYILIDMERWSEASAALTQALEKGGLKDRETGEAYLMLGMSEFSQDNYSAANTAWRQAGRFPDTRAQSQQWLTHMQEERERQAAL
jgi:tetratricopeptide (TPR) repeat protein